MPSRLTHLRWKSKFNINHGTATILQCFLWLIFAAHWFACILALQASLHPEPAVTFLGDHAYGLCEKSTAAVNGTSSMVTLTAGEYVVGGRRLEALAGCGGRMSLGSFYLASLSLSIMLITGTGGER